MSNQYKPYKPSHIANFFLKAADKEYFDVTQMKLQKLVYMGYGWVLALLDRKLFDDEIEAWEHGPVVRSLYDEFKHFGKDPIDCFATECEFYESAIEPNIENSDKDVIMILGKVWYIFKHYSAWQLRNITHDKDAPWEKTYKKGESCPIPSDLIREHFKERIKKYLEAGKQ